jgi:putative transposase
MGARDREPRVRRSYGRYLVALWNWHRPHTALGGRSPIDRVCELTAITPSAEVVDAAYDPAKERIRVASYVTDKTLARVK